MCNVYGLVKVIRGQKSLKKALCFYVDNYLSLSHCFFLSFYWSSYVDVKTLYASAYNLEEVRKILHILKILDIRY